MGAKGSKWQAIPFTIEPRRGQVSENSAHSPSKQSCHVFHDDDSRLHLKNDPVHFSPRPSAAFAVHSSLVSGMADVLAVKPAADDVNPRKLESLSTEFVVAGTMSTTVSDIAESLGVWEVLCKHSSAVVINFDLPDRLDSRAFKAKVESPYS